MDSDLFKRWQQNEMPFNQKVLLPKNTLTLPQLSTITKIVAEYLSDTLSNLSLFHFLDWHEHDGWITDATSTQWDSILQYSEYLLSPIAISNADLDDTHVYHAYYPHDFSFLLRFDTDIDLIKSIFPWKRTLGAFGYFDFAASPYLISSVKTQLESKTHLRFMIKPAKPYFDHCYAGIKDSGWKS